MKTLNDIRGMGIIFDGEDVNIERFHYLKYLAALFAYTMPVDKECNPTVVVRSTYWGAYWYVLCFVPPLILWVVQMNDTRSSPKNEIDPLRDECVSFRIPYSSPQSCHDRCTTAFYLENMAYAPPTYWWYNRLDIGCAYAYWFMHQPAYQPYFKCQGNLGPKTMALAFEKPYYRGYTSSYFKNTCSKFDARMSVKVPPVYTFPYSDFVTSAPTGDVEVWRKEDF